MNLGQENCLASLWQRLQAALLDGLLIFGPVVVVTLTFSKPEDIGVLVGLYVVALGVWQSVLLSKHGQTIGKQVMKIKIVRCTDGANGGFVTNVVLRCFVNGLIGLIPLYHLVDVAFIFGEGQRCLHDRIAGTMVVAE